MVVVWALWEFVLRVLVFRLPIFVYRIAVDRQPEKGCCFMVGFERSFNHASRADGALPFLCLAKEKEAKERRPRRAGLLRRLPSLRILFSARAN